MLEIPSSNELYAMNGGNGDMQRITWLRYWHREPLETKGGHSTLGNKYNVPFDSKCSLSHCLTDVLFAA